MKSELKIFDGFQLDLACEFTGLSVAQVKTLRLHGIVAPVKRAGSYLYSFRDLLMLRLIKILKELEVTPTNIVRAHQYLGDLNLGHNLSNTKLWLRSDTKDILGLGDELTSVALNRHGQLVAKCLVEAIPVGRPLENMRQKVLNFDNALCAGLRPGKTFQLDELRRKYDIA
jgi:DNA-binding transcriptional MerR regulator